MVRVDPEAALDTFVEVYEMPPVKRAALRTARAPVASVRTRRAAGATPSADELAAARRSVAELARDREWWVRVYAVSALAAAPELGSPELLAPLRKDENEIVRKAVTEVGNKQ